MNWIAQQQWLAERLPAEVAWFIRLTLVRLLAENVFDAPSVISRILTEMRAAESEAIRAAARHTEPLLRAAFAPRLQRTRGA